MKTRKKIPGIRFRKRLGTAILAAVMIVSSMQLPGGKSYAAGLTGSSMEDGQNASILNEEETGSPETMEESESPMEDTAAADDDSHIEEENQTDVENNLEKEDDAGQVSDYEPEPSDRIVNINIEGALQFGDMPDQEYAQETNEGAASRTAYNYDDDYVDNYVYQQMLQRVEYIDLYEAEYYSLTEDRVAYWLGTFLNEHPDLYYVQKECQYVADDTSGGTFRTVKALIITYSDDTYQEIDYDTFREKTNEALSYITDGMSELEKVVVLHDWLAVNCCYGRRTDDNLYYTAYGPLVNGVAVCNGYTLAFRHLLNTAGIENYYVYSRDMNHSWNMVKLGDNYYNIDVTWDGQDNAGHAYHTFLLVSDYNNAHSSDRKVKDGNKVIDCHATDQTYEKAFWTGSSTAFLNGLDNCYYISIFDGMLKKGDFSNILDAGKVIADSKIKPGGDPYPQFTCVIPINDRLFFNDAYSIYSIRTDGTDMRTEFTADSTEPYYIRGIRYLEGKIYYYVYEGKNELGKLLAPIELGTPEPQKYRIMYRLDGGTNDSANPDSYYSGTDTITLKAPTKDGFLFEGWYADETFSLKVTEIPKESAAHIILYAKWRPIPDNPAYTFMTVEDKTVNGRANGKPKVLVFFKTSVEASRKTTADLSEHIKAFDGVDIYAIEAYDQRTKDEVAAYQKQYGCNEITFCYDRDGSNGAYAEEYTSSAATGPVVVIIDEENRVQRVTSGRRTWIGILKDLQEYCSYDTRYGIRYELNGGENNSDNPYMYQIGEGSISLHAPSKHGYTFEGWYTDRALTEQVTEITRESGRNITLYAKWGSHGGFYAANYKASFTTLDDTKLSSLADGRPKLLVFYDDAESESISMIKNLSGIADDLGWVDVYAIDINRNALDKEKIRSFRDTYGCEGITFTYMSTLVEGTRYENSMKQYLQKAGIEASAAVSPVICYIDEWDYFQWISQGTISAPAVLENLKKYCACPPQDGGAYKITYKLDGGKNDMRNPASYTSGADTITLQEACKSGYIFDGWYEDAAYTKRITGIAGGTTGNLTFYAKWNMEKKHGLTNLNVQFTALDGTKFTSQADSRPRLLIFYNVLESDSASAISDLSGIADSLDGLDIYAVNVYNGKLDGKPMTASILDKNVVTQFRTDYGCSGITFAYMSDTGEWQNYGKYMNQYLQKAGMDASTAAAPVICYIDKDNSLQWVSQGAATAADIMENLEKSCGYSAEEESIYEISYRLDGGRNAVGNPTVYMSGIDTIVLKDAARSGYTFNGWYKDAMYTEQITEIAKESTGDITLYAKWEMLLPAEEYTKLDDTKVSAVAKGKPKLLLFYRQLNYCSQSTIRSIRDQIEDFDGVDICAIEVSQETKDSVRTYQGADGCAEMVFCYDTGDGNKNSMLAYVAAGDLAEPDFGRTLSNTLPIICYLDAENRLQYLGQGEVTADDILLNLKTYCNHLPRRKGEIYQIRYVLDGGTNGIGNPETYTFETDTLTLADPFKADFVFEGWYKDAAFKERVTEISKGSTGDIILYAKWAQGEMADVVYLIKRPDKTTYKVDEAPDVTGGRIRVDRKKTGMLEEYDMETSMLKDFDSSTPGIHTVTVAYDGYTNHFEVLIAADLEVTVKRGQKLSDISFPEYEYGEYVWAEDIGFSGELTETGVYTYGVVFVPNDMEKFQMLELELEVRVTETGEPEKPDDPDVPDDREPGTYKVAFNMQGHGTAPETLTNVKAGATIDSPKEPTAEGYRFDGWYKDTACTLAWDFENDTVQSDLTLYAKWLGISSSGEFTVQEISDVYYTGKAQKPAISVYDNGRLLKAGKDYTIKYYNNIDANAGGVLKGEEFNPKLPYVAVTGKGNYKETVKINFNILRASIGDNYTPAAGVTLKVNDHLVKGTKALKPFGSVKFGRSMKAGIDYELKLEAMIARDASGELVFGSFDNAQIPAGYTGEFVLTVKGVGNYTGSISRNVYVADKAHLMKNVKITLGKDLKNISYTGSRIELKAAEKQKPAADEFVVTYGKTVLKPNEDYYVTYHNNIGVGKAELVVIGKGEYTGRKTASFNIKGKKFANETVTVEGLEDQTYTGRAVVQNQNVVLTWKADGTKLVYGQDYTISYSKNINKGTATITFTGRAEAGYSGKISRKFRIGAADIADVSRVTRAESINAITLPYSKAGVKPVEEIILTNERGTRLRLGKDYTLAYKNNKAVASADAKEAPTVTVKGKGNYSGTFDVKFTITRADLNSGNITVECTQMAYNNKKPDSYVYKPAIKVKDGTKTLKAGTDYEITYEKNTQADCRNYMQNLIDNQLTVPPMEGRAMAVITEKAGSAYSLQEPIRIPLEIYQEKLKKSDLDVQIGQAVYTGGQVRPKVTVKYKGMLLEEDVDYTLVYGANTISGKNKGSVTVIGLAPDYGGGITYKFEIIRKELKYRNHPVVDDEK